MSDLFRVAIIGHTGRGNYGHFLDGVFEGVKGTEVVALADPDEVGSHPCRPTARCAQVGQRTPSYGAFHGHHDEGRSAGIRTCDGRKRPPRFAASRC
jgi:hypothetical protein